MSPGSLIYGPSAAITLLRTNAAKTNLGAEFLADGVIVNTKARTSPAREDIYGVSQSGSIYNLTVARVLSSGVIFTHRFCWEVE